MFVSLRMGLSKKFVLLYVWEIFHTSSVIDTLQMVKDVKRNISLATFLHHSAHNFSNHFKSHARKHLLIR